MRRFYAIVISLLAVLLCGKSIQSILNIFSMLMFWMPGTIHAILVVRNHLADKRAQKVVQAIRQSNWKENKMMTCVHF
jgi:uncharacterized membrane protein YqaE (UPF0057 family)